MTSVIVYDIGNRSGATEVSTTYPANVNVEIGLVGPTTGRKKRNIIEKVIALLDSEEVRDLVRKRR